MSFWHILLIWNLIVFFIYGIDKWKATRGAWRISEAFLIGCSFLLGSLGALFGMVLFNHKTKKMKFRLLVPFSFLLHIFLNLYGEQLWNMLTL